MSTFSGTQLGCKIRAQCTLTFQLVCSSAKWQNTKIIPFVRTSPSPESEISALSPQKLFESLKSK